MTWVEVVDKNSGRTYYYNRATKQTQWKKPADFDGPEADSGGGDNGDDDKQYWVAAADKKSGRTYFYNKRTKKTQWKKPACFDEDEEVPQLKKKKKPSHDAAAVAAAADADDFGDPNNWREVKDKATGRTYYYNKVTKKTSWKKPRGFGENVAEEDEEEKVQARPIVQRDDTGIHDIADHLEEERNYRYSEFMDESVSRPSLLDDREEDEEDVRKGKRRLDDSDEENYTSSSITGNLVFAKHRKGFVKRTFHLGQALDEKKLLSFKKSLIKKALLKQNREYDAEAIQSFKNIMSYMGDRKSHKSLVGHVRKLIFNGLQAPESLKDEMFLQVCKQVNNHPNLAHTIRGWELMTILLAAFPPSRKMAAFLEDFFDKHRRDDGVDSDIRRLAQVCLERLDRIMKLGPRAEVPSTTEVKREQDGLQVPILIYTLDNARYTVEVDAFTPVREVTETIIHRIGLSFSSPFSLFEFSKDGEEKILDEESRILDVLASWERIAHEKKINSPEPFRFVFKAELVLKTTDRGLVDDEEAVSLMYIQAFHDVTTERYPPEERDCASLAALYLQAQFGDYQPDVHNDDWMKERLLELIPPSLIRAKKSKKRQQQMAEYSQKILTKYAKLRGVSTQESQLSYLDYVQDWPLYGASFVTVEQKQLKDYPPYIRIAITSEAIRLVHPETKDILDSFGYHEIVTWGYSDEKFILVVGNLVQQRKLFFKTNRGRFMNKLVHDYVKMKVPQQ